MSDDKISDEEKAAFMTMLEASNGEMEVIQRSRQALVAKALVLDCRISILPGMSSIDNTRYYIFTVSNKVQFKGEKLKLFVWEGVLTDYTSGIVFALAYNKEHARALVAEKYSSGYQDKTRRRQEILKEISSAPEEVETPEAFYLHGGG